MVDVRERSNIVTVRQSMVDVRERSNIVTVSKVWLMWEKEVILLP